MSQSQITKKLAQLPEDVKSVYLLDPSKGRITMYNQKMEVILIDWLVDVMKLESRLFYDTYMVETEYEKKRLEHLILDCAYTLINFIIHNVCKNLVNLKVLQCIGITCIYAASTVIVAHDLEVPQRPLLNFLASNSPEDCAKEKIFEIFEDILKRTNGELCSANIHIQRRYENDIDEKNGINELSNMVIQGREMIQDALDNEEKNNKITEKYLKNLKKKRAGNIRTFVLEYENDQFILIDTQDNEVYTPDDPPSGVLKANFIVTRSLVNKIARTKKKLMDETFIWLRDRVIKVGYEIEPLSFEYVDQSSYQMRSKSRKASRKSRKSPRKSRKASRKVSRKSRKSPRKSRKSRKVSRKSLRKSPRKSRKVSRKSSRKTIL